ncbi:MAG: RNA polymerase factor sigma-54 [Bacteroidetes bacterium]|nr:RNA polymerase factor sigma-54 [Bacteroidota bacterium]
MLKQYLQLKLGQKLSPQQIQLMKLIQLPTQAFEERLRQEIEENPALETGKEETDDPYDLEDQEEDQHDENEQNDEIDLEDYLSDDETPDYKTSSNNGTPEQEYQTPYAAGKTFYGHLIEQLGTFEIDPNQYIIAEYLIGSLDESGYLRRPIEDIVDDLAFSTGLITDNKSILEALQIVQQLDPAGVGARDIAECLLIQLKRQPASSTRDTAITIVSTSFEQFSKKHYDKLLQRHKIDEETLRESIAKIERLNPKPGGGFTGNLKGNQQIIPDFILRIEDDELVLKLNARNAPELHLSRSYKELLDTYKHGTSSSSQKEAVQFLKQKLDSAKWFIDAIKQRQHTLIVTLNAIVKYQSAFFLSGDDRDLRPMILRDIAEITGLDISTISRVANSKYIETPYGTQLVKSYFSEAMTNDEGESVSTREIKSKLKELIDKEDKAKPLTDEKLGKLLKEKGYVVARRTVAKYREQLELPVARLRKLL